MTLGLVDMIENKYRRASLNLPWAASSFSPELPRMLVVAQWGFNFVTKVRTGY